MRTAKKKKKKKKGYGVGPSLDQLIDCHTLLTQRFKNLLAPLQTELDRVQARCRARTLDAAQVMQAVIALEKHLHMIPKARLVGTVAVLNLHSGRFPASYHYRPESTHITLLYKRGEWRITEIKRAYCHNTRCLLTLPQKALDVIHNYYASELWI